MPGTMIMGRKEETTQRKTMLDGLISNNSPRRIYPSSLWWMKNVFVALFNPLI
jgi:hypothetical protein